MLFDKYCKNSTFCRLITFFSRIFCKLFTKIFVTCFLNPNYSDNLVLGSDLMPKSELVKNKLFKVPNTVFDD